MRKEIEISIEDLSLLNHLSERQGMSPEELIQKAISSLIQPHKQARAEAFGSWKHIDGDSLDYLDKLRSELWR